MTTLVAENQSPVMPGRPNVGGGGDGVGVVDTDPVRIVPSIGTAMKIIS